MNKLLIAIIALLVLNLTNACSGSLDKSPTQTECNDQTSASSTTKCCWISYKPTGTTTAAQYCAPIIDNADAIGVVVKATELLGGSVDIQCSGRYLTVGIIAALALMF